MAAQVGDIGTIIRYTTTTDVSNASTLTLKYLKPDGSGSTIAGEWTASVYATYSAQFTTTAATDLDQEGTWILQVYADLAAWTGHAEKKEFTVKSNIPAAAA